MHNYAPKSQVVFFFQLDKDFVFDGMLPGWWDMGGKREVAVPPCMLTCALQDIDVLMEG